MMYMYHIEIYTFKFIHTLKYNIANVYILTHEDNYCASIVLYPHLYEE